ncbi:MAG: hypothetical protein VYE22_22645 [Myxococcota bacterium]|nr:hypothetical protein [Myxococcota bacterium]
MTRFLLTSLAALAIACGGPSAPPPVEEEVESAGGEDESVEPDPVVRTTTPVPVPQPAVAREAMTEALQALWTQIEEVVAMRPPEPPEEPSMEAIQAWADGPLADWLEARHDAMGVAREISEGVPDEPSYERAVGAALFAYALEDLAADVRGAPVPEEIASDPELLEIYTEHLDAAIRPIATESVVSYAYCQRRIAELGDDSEWLPWRAYCVQRGREVIEVYRLQEDRDPTPSEPQSRWAPRRYHAPMIARSSSVMPVRFESGI